MSRKSLLIVVIALLLCIAAFGSVYYFTRPETETGLKNVSVEVIVGSELKNTFQYKTEYEYLGQLLTEEGLISGTVSTFGLWIETVDGVTADPSKEEWWMLTKAGVMTETGIDTTPVSDGDVFGLELKVGYDEAF
jgi:hypothetical protein